ncbi:MAG: FHA domain-containing protein [Anaerolineae bacterium]|nr:FHA domain-containing protein [Anaerolineae bacterium]MDW8067870.1 FHA domain-containing protein [Anaerolineae bacterium]
MIECPSCSKQHRLGTLFCTECGVYLPTSKTLRTEPFPTDELAAPRAATWEVETLEPQRERAPQVVRVRILHTQREVVLPALPELLLGRLDPTHGIFPHLDLGVEDGLKMGVSRRHARITQREGKVYIEDVGSANGTFLNGQRLTPYLPYPLPKESEVQLGRLRLHVTIGTGEGTEQASVR